VYAVAAYNTNLDTMFWTAYLSTQKRWSDVIPTARNIQLVQTEILYKVGGLIVLSRLLPLACTLSHTRNIPSRRNVKLSLKH
jgi:hypothetical protein